jgi:hypothetical protein
MIDEWKAVEELTEIQRVFDPSDPVKYDFEFFELGVLKVTKYRIIYVYFTQYYIRQ